MSNSIDKYRATHRRIRRILERYTADLCPVCSEPCCIKPTRVAEFDVLLANACGCSLPSTNPAVREKVEAGIQALLGHRDSSGRMEPCEYLGEQGCVFPGDLRPFECTRWICRPIKRAISPGEMRELRELLHKLGVLHRELLDTVTPQGR
jgi:hypothetical protein